MMNLYRLTNKYKYKFYIVAADEVSAKQHAVRCHRARNVNNLAIETITNSQADLTILKVVKSPCEVCVAHYGNGNRQWVTGFSGLFPIQQPASGLAV